ncbi:MAG: FAD:protein FMN transferase [Bacteroidales bacterium]|nr:FAD:protein FMN transferase [Bacteroidales bacterium]
MRNFIIVLLLGCVLISCNKISSNYVNFRGFVQGTTYNITYSSVDSIVYKDQIEALLAVFDTSLSTYNKQSLITKINNNKSKKTDEYFNEVFEKSKEVYTKTNGAFDITVAPLVNYWGFGFENKDEIADTSIVSILNYVGLDKVKLSNSIIEKADPRVTIDANAIAQGYSVDIVAKFLDTKGVSNYLIEIGGELKTKGVNKKGKVWRIGIDRPFDNNNIPGQNLQAIIKLQDKSLATSGNYRKFYERDGIKYSHTINPKTGYPVNHTLLSVTVIADDCMTADAYATAFMVLGLEKSLQLIKKLDNIEAYFIYSDKNGKYQVKSTPEIKKLITEV